MPDGKKVKIKTWEDFGTTPEEQGYETPSAPYIPPLPDPVNFSYQGEQYRGSLFEELKSKGLTTDLKMNIPQFDEEGNIYYKGEPKKEDLTFQERGSNITEDLLLSTNQHNTGAGEVGREILSPIVSGGVRTVEGVKDLFTTNPMEFTKAQGSILLGLAETLFGGVMAPFTALRLGGETTGQIASDIFGTDKETSKEIGGKAAEISGLLVTGGIPLIAGYFASQGATELSDKLTQGTNLTPKEKETVQSVTGLFSFVLAHKITAKGKAKIEDVATRKVNQWIEESVPEFKQFSPKTTIEEVTSKLFEKDYSEIIKKPYEAPTQIMGDVGKKIDLELPKELKQEREFKTKTLDLENQMRVAEKSGNEAEFNRLSQERDGILGKKEIETKVEENIQETKNVRESKNQEKLIKVKEKALTIFNQEPSLSARDLQKKLNASKNKGEIEGTFNVENVKEWVDEFKKEYSKTKETKIVDNSEKPLTNIEDIKNVDVGNLFGEMRNPHITADVVLRDFPELESRLIDKTSKEIKDIVHKFWFTERGKETPKEEIPKVEEVAEVKPQIKKTKKLSSEDVEIKAQERAGREQIKAADFSKKTKPVEEVSEYDKLLNTSLDEIFGTSEQRAKKKAEIKTRNQKRGGKLTAGGDAPGYLRDIAEMSLVKVAEGVHTFSKFSKEMVEEFGESVKPRLQGLYEFARKNTVIQDKPIKDWIEQNKKGLNLELEEVKGKIVDPTSGLEGGARHLPKKDKSVIQFNENTQGDTWYHELSHALYNARERTLTTQEKADVKTIIGESSKGLNEQFADAFTEMYTNPDVPKTKLFEDIQKEFNIPTSYEIVPRKKIALEEQAFERKKGKRQEHDIAWLSKKYDAPNEVVGSVYGTRQSKLYQSLRDDGTKKFEEVVAESKQYGNITEESLLGIDPKTLTDTKGNPVMFNDAQQYRISQIAVNKSLKVMELGKSFGEGMSQEQAILFKQEMIESVKLHAMSKNNLREAARVMNVEKQRNKITPQEYQFLKEIKERFRKIKTENPKDVLEKADKLMELTLRDKVLFWWYNAILSNPLTDIANIMGNSSNFAWELLTQPQDIRFIGKGLREGFKNAGRVWRGEQRGASKFYSDVPDLYREVFPTKGKFTTRLKNTLLPTSRLAIEDAFFRGILETTRESKQSKITGKELGLKPQEVQVAYNRILESEKIQNQLNLVERSLKDIRKSLPEELQNEIFSLERGMKKAQNEGNVEKYRGLQETLAEKLPDDIINKEILRKELKDAKENALDLPQQLKDNLDRLQSEIDAIESYAAEMVFQKPLGETGQKGQKFLSSPIMTPFKMLALPFLRIAVNLTKVSLKSTPLPLLRPKNFANATRQMLGKDPKNASPMEVTDMVRRAMAGTAFYTGLLNLIGDGSQFEIVGSAPQNKDLRDLWLKQGYRENSFIIHNEDETITSIPFLNVSPINIVLGTLGSLYVTAKWDNPTSEEEEKRFLDLASEKVFSSLVGITEALGNQSFMESTSRLIVAISRKDGELIETSVIRMASPNLLGIFGEDFPQGADFEAMGIGKAGKIYEVEGIVDKFKNRYKPIFNFFEEQNFPVKVDVAGEEMRSMYQRFPIPSKREENKLAKFLGKHELTIGNPNNPKNYKGKKIFTTEEFNEYKKLYRQNTWKSLNSFMPLLQNLVKSGDFGVLAAEKLVAKLKEAARVIAQTEIRYGNNKISKETENILKQIGIQ